MATPFPNRHRRRTSRPLLTALLLLAPLVPAARAEPGDVVTEVTLRQAGGKKRRVSADTLKTALEKRLSILSESPGKASVDKEGLIHVRVVEPDITKAQLDWFTRPGAVEVAWLPDVQTPGNPNGRYAVTMYGVQGTLSLRFMDREAGRFVPAATLLGRAPRLVSGDELDRQGAAPATAPGVLALKFGARGTRRLARFARAHEGAFLIVLVDDAMIGVPVVIPPRGEQVNDDGTVISQPTPVEQGHLEVTTTLSTPAEFGHLVTVINTAPIPGLTVVEKKTFVE